MIRVLVVDDSVTVRRWLVEILTADPEIEVVGEAYDGKRAVERCRDLRPDVITMDLIMTTMSGIDAIKDIMVQHPTPILVVSSAASRTELFRTYEALAAGAVDVMEKPGGDEAEGAWEARFRSTVKLVSRIKVITHLRRRTPTGAVTDLSSLAVPSRSTRACAVVGVGASTGGPGAVVEVLRGLPADFALPILLVLHIGEPFGRALAEWLGGQIGRPVAYAQDGEPILAASGRVLMAPPGRHLEVRAGRARLTIDPERHSCRPSVDVLFESIASEFGASAMACLLTGMGRDGAAGLLRIRQAGGLTIAQDEATSAVYGMPREAALLGAASRVLPLGEIARVLKGLTP